VPQAPQLTLSVWRLAQATPASESHAVCPVAQFAAQAPPVHTCPLGHTVPQAPQFWRSLARLAHVPLQAPCPAGQLTAHAPDTHAMPAPQRAPHAPQLAGSDEVSTQRSPQVASPLPSHWNPLSSGASATPRSVPPSTPPTTEEPVHAESATPRRRPHASRDLILIE